MTILEGALAEEVRWTPTQCRTVFRAILDSPYRVVPEKKMLSLLGKDGRKILYRLAEADVVWCR